MDSGVVVYIIRCVDGLHYCGITNNILRRMLEHAREPHYFMQRHPPQRLVFLSREFDRSTAAAFERSIKRVGVTRWYRRHVHDQLLRSQTVHFPAH